MSSVLRLVLFATLTGLLPAGNASANGPCPLPERLGAFIATVSDYPAGSTCPVIRRGGFEPPDERVQYSQAGAFFPNTGEIQLASDLDLATPLGQSYLVHELVHLAQHLNGAPSRVRCTGELEAEAYRVQAAFLRRHGLPVESVLVSFLGETLGRCNPPENLANSSD